MNMIFYSHASKTHFHNKGLALGLALKVRGFGTRKWPIESCRRKFDIEQTVRCRAILFVQQRNNAQFGCYLTIIHRARMGALSQ